MDVLGLALLIGWVLVVAAVPSYRELRRTGTIRPRAVDRPGSPQWWSRIVSSVGFALALAAPLGDVVGLPAIDAIDRPAVRVVGVVLVLAGIVLTLVAQAEMGESWRPDVDPQARTDLVTSGPFRWVRNPALTGAAVSSVGLVLVIANVLAVAMLILSVIAWQIQVRLVEEPYLLGVHGDAYRRYAARVGRFVPGLGRLPPPRDLAEDEVAQPRQPSRGA